MSAAKQTFIYCDGGKECPEDGCYAHSDASNMTAAQQRVDYVLDGWLNKGSKDYCPACAKRLFNHTMTNSRDGREG